MNQVEFIKTINPFKDKLFRLAKRLLISNDEAQDATQEILIKLWNKKKDLKSYKNLESFAMTITKNYCLDELKSKKSSNLKIENFEFENKNNNLIKDLEISDSLNWIKKAINNLPEQQKIIIQLREIEQYEFDEIAKIVGMNETAIRVALSRARKSVKEFMIKTDNYGL